LVSWSFCSRISMARAVGKTSNSILRRFASRFTSSITGNAPVPVPTTKQRHFHGIFSSTDSGVCPKTVAEFLGRSFPALADFPTVDHHVVFVSDAIDANGAE
jgi:hypothetical protein